MNDIGENYAIDTVDWNLYWYNNQAVYASIFLLISNSLYSTQHIYN
jgi:hypothetical protein